MFRKQHLPVVFILSAVTLGFGLFSSKTGHGEVVFAATEVGTPEGDKVTRDVEGIDMDKQRIEWNVKATATVSVMGRSVGVPERATSSI